MGKVIKAVYTNGVFRPLERVVLPEGEPVQGARAGEIATLT